jgi:hypothetical protein
MFAKNWRAGALPRFIADFAVNGRAEALPSRKKKISNVQFSTFNCV